MKAEIFPKNASVLIKFAESIPNKPIVFLFYMSECRFCAPMIPKFGELSDYFENDDRIIFSKVNCREYERTCNTLDIKVFPRFLIFYNKTSKLGASRSYIDHVYDFGFSIFEEYVSSPFISIEKKNRTYPSFYIEYSTSNYSFINNIRKYLYPDKYSKKLFYVKQVKGHNSINWATAEDSVIPYIDIVTDDAIRNFIKHYSSTINESALPVSEEEANTSIIDEFKENENDFQLENLYWFWIVVLIVCFVIYYLMKNPRRIKLLIRRYYKKFLNFIAPESHSYQV